MNVASSGLGRIVPSHNMVKALGWYDNDGGCSTLLVDRVNLFG